MSVKLQKYVNEYRNEEELNAQLNIFAVSYSVAYGGFNNIKTQVGYNSLEG